MPSYSSLCRACGTHFEYIRKVDARNDTPICCDAQTEKQLDTPMISAMAFTGHKGFHMPDANNTWIESGHQYHKYIKENNLIVGQEGKREAEINKARIEKEANESRRKTVEQIVSQATSS